MLRSLKGRWLVPLNATETLADLAQALSLPVIMVVGMRLGCINHALTAAAIQRQGFSLLMDCQCQWAGTHAWFGANLDTLVARLPAPCWEACHGLSSLMIPVSMALNLAPLTG